MKKRLILFGILFISSALSASVESQASKKQDNGPRFIRIPSGSGTSQATNRYNSATIPILESSGNTAKTQTTNPSTASTSKVIPVTTPKNHGSTIYEVQDQMQPPKANAGHYVFSVTSQQQQQQQQQPGQTTQGFIPTAGPVLMQLLTPQGQPTGQMQYIQFLQPVVVPLMSKNYLQTALQQGALPQITQQTSAPQSTIQVQSAAAAVAQQYQPTTQAPPAVGYYPYSQPITSFSTPVASYYHPSVYSSNRIQLVSGPGDLSLNTNEYIPAPSELSFSAVKPIRP